MLKAKFCIRYKTHLVSFCFCYSVKLGGTCGATTECTDVIANSECTSKKCACASGYAAAAGDVSCIRGKQYRCIICSCVNRSWIELLLLKVLLIHWLAELGPFLSDQLCWDNFKQCHWLNSLYWQLVKNSHLRPVYRRDWVFL